MYLGLKPKHIGDVKNRSAVSSIFIGDEVDGKMDSNLRTPIPAQMNRLYPEIPTYQGAKTNAHVGSYSGITDIQGMDAYIGACAPTIVPVIKPLPIEYPYLYLLNTRNNHMPLPTWLYSQMYSDAWSYQCNGNELTTQIAMTVLAGGKGVTLFESYQDNFKKHDTKGIKRVLTSFQALGEDIRTGDINGAIISGADGAKNVLVGTIRSPGKLIVVVLNVDAKGYSNLTCHIYLGKHWTFQKTTAPDLTVSIPSNLKLSNPKEQLGSDSASISGVSVSGNTAKISGLQLDDDITARFIVFDVSA